MSCIIWASSSWLISILIVSFWSVFTQVAYCCPTTDGLSFVGAFDSLMAQSCLRRNEVAISVLFWHSCQLYMWAFIAGNWIIISSSSVFPQSLWSASRRTLCCSGAVVFDDIMSKIPAGFDLLFLIIWWMVDSVDTSQIAYPHTHWLSNLPTFTSAKLVFGAWRPKSSFHLSRWALVRHAFYAGQHGCWVNTSNW